MIRNTLALATALACATLPTTTPAVDTIFADAYACGLGVSAACARRERREAFDRLQESLDAQRHAQQYDQMQLQRELQELNQQLQQLRNR